jgi:hypothetical protein
MSGAELSPSESVHGCMQMAVCKLACGRDMTTGEKVAWDVHCCGAVLLSVGDSATHLHGPSMADESGSGAAPVPAA